MINKISFGFLLLLFSCIQNTNAQTATFSQTYTNGVTPTAQCTAWNTFIASLSSSGNYVKMSITGTYDATGIVCTDKTIITAFVAACKTGGTTSYMSGLTNGHYWSICNRYSGEIWIDPPALCSGSNCPSPGYIIRPCIGNLNWGGVNTATCGGLTQVMTLKFEMPTKPNDAGISAIATPLCAPNIVVTYNNNGTNRLDSAKINWTVNGTAQPQNKYTTPINQGAAAANITLTPNYAFVDGTTYTVKAWTSLPNNKVDSVPGNDTFKITFKYLGPAGVPGVTDIIKCGPGKVPLKAIPVNQTDSIVWYNVATGGSVIGRGKNFTTPALVLGVNTYYAQAFKFGSPTAFANAMTPSVGYGSTYSGGFADITPKSDLLIDSFDVQMTANIQNATWNVYIRTGTYIGFNNVPTAWTRLVNNAPARVRQVGTYWRSYIKIPETLLSKGVTYGFYITSTPTTPCSPWCNATVTGGITISNPDMTVFQDRICYGAEFTGSVGLNLPMTLETHYRTANCPSARAALKVTVKPSPNGAAFIKSTPFQTTQPNTLGSVGNPDIVAKDDVLTYEITPPTGYNNVDYGTTWIMSGFTFRTKSGRILPSTYYTPSSPAPSGSANAKVTFTADAAIVDSTIIMTVSISDLGPHYCDSTLTRNIFVAPRPLVDFKFNKPVCDGDNVIFTNTSSTTSGGLTNKWNFGTGNPADTSVSSDVIFIFPTYGNYNVTLTTTTVPYGYTKSITIPVEVTEIPKIGFKVFNACLGDSVSFVNSTSISSGAIVYNWNFGNGTTSKKVNPKNKYPIAGGYKVTLTASSNGCVQTLTKSAQQFARPIAKFNIPTLLCDKTDVQFTNGSTIPIGNMGYNWSFGDGAISNFASPIHKYSTPGVKVVKMRVLSEFGCADSLTKTLTLAEAPLADFKNTSACNLSSTNFTFNGTKPTGFTTNFNWDFAGEGTSFTENPTKIFSTIGKKRITLTTTSNNGCSDIISKEINVKLQSKADFSVADVCEGEEAVFTNKSSVSSGSLLFDWKFGDSKTSALQSPRHLYPAGISTTYNVTLVANVPGGCSDSITKAVSVNANPISDFSFNISGRLVYFNAFQLSNTSYHWNFGDGGTSDISVTKYHYLNSLPTVKHIACLTTENAAGCITKTCKEISITQAIQNLTKINGVNIFPNPNKGNFTLTIENPKSDISIIVYNLLGEVIKTIETNPFKSVYAIELNEANGIYLIQVNNGGIITSQKVTINK